MSTILFPTDFSITANNAFLYALNLAKVLKFDIKLITLTTHLKEENNMQENDFNEKVNQLKLLAAEYDLGSIDIRSSLEHGDLLFTLLKIVKEEDVRYIVMGTNGENNFDKKLFGSVTLSVINNSTVPVLAVPNKVKYKKERNFAYASLLQPNEETALKNMLAITKAHHAELTVLHVETKNPDIDTRINNREWEVDHPEVNLEVLTGDNVEDTLLAYCDVYNIDILGIFHRDLNIFQRLFSKNHSEKLIINADFAILVLKE